MNPRKAEYIISAVSKKQYPNYSYPTFVFLGRSNVGKSSFINALVNRKNLAYTSSKPGKTIALNFYNIDDMFMFVDVPGYGYAQKKVEDRLGFGKMIEEFLNNYSSLKLCFLVIDLRHEPTEDDVLMYNYLKHLHQNIVIVATKADKLSNNQMHNALKVVKDKLDLRENDMVFAISSVTKYGIDKIEQVLYRYVPKV
ncbi:MAG: ribosome biogenesis GTP-binding protein YihA/YsxC [Bacilli bacterium]